MHSAPALVESNIRTTVYRPRMHFRVQMALALLLFAVAGVVIFAAGTSWPWVSATGVLNGLLAGFLLLTAVGSRLLHVSVTEDGIEFTLPRPGNTTLMPWMLLSATVRWDQIQAVDVRERNVILNKTSYILRTTAGDAFFFSPNWRSARQLAERILQRSGAATSYENLLAVAEIDPAKPATRHKPSTAERAAHLLGIVLAVAAGTAALLLLVAAFVGGPEGRSSIWLAIFMLSLPASGAVALMKFRRMR
ncbi:MAG: hypothetical protein WAV67_10905 [Dokdonella sp.]